MDDIFETLSETAARHPGSIALAARAGYMNYGDLVGNISSAANALAKNGVEAGQLVVPAATNPDASLILALALMRLGCRVGYSRDVGLYDANGVAVDAVIADAPILGSAHRTIVIAKDWFRGAEGLNLNLPAPATDYSTIFASSGSTGVPKLIEYDRTALIDRVAGRTRHAAGGEQPRLLSTMGNRTGAHFSNSLAFLLRGGMVIGMPSRDGSTVLDTIQLFRPNYANMAPSTIAEVLKCLDEKPAAMEKIPLIRAAGSGCSPELQMAALDRIAEELIFSYGSTESPGIAWGYSRDVLKIEGCVGRIADGIEVAAFGPDGQRLPAGTEGEIRVKRPQGTGGRYIGDYAKQQKAFKDGWFATGDIGLVDENRTLIIRGRASNIINIGGSKVNPELIEAEIRTFSQVRDVGVTGVDRPEGFEQICAAIVSNTKLTADDVNAHLRRRNARWPVQMVKLVPAIPKTETGKIDRPALKRLCADGD